MKKILLLLACCFAMNAHSQSLHPDKWTFKVEEKGNGEAEIIFKIKLDPEWHVYAQSSADGGPLQMLFTFDSTDCFTRNGNVTEPVPIQEFDSVFGVTVSFFNKETEFRQKIKYKGNSCTVKGNVSYQVCKDVCLPRDTTFTIKIGKGNGGKSEPIPAGKTEGSINFHPINDEAFSFFIKPEGII